MVTVGAFFYIKGVECSLSGVRFQREWVGDGLDLGFLYPHVGQRVY